MPIQCWCKTPNIGEDPSEEHQPTTIQCWCKTPNIGEDPSEEHQPTTVIFLLLARYSSAIKLRLRRTCLAGEEDWAFIVA